MGGSSLFSIFIDKVKGEKIAFWAFALAALAMGMIAMFEGRTMKFLGMNVFEVTVGIYFPVMGTLKGAIVPEAKRAGIYNLYRIPLNLIVLFSLLTDLTPQTSFALNCLMLLAATFLQYILMKRRESYGLTEQAVQEGSTEKLIEPVAEIEAV